MLRKVQNVSNQLLNEEKWNRYIGRELSECKVGIVGNGRIGKIVSTMLQGFGCNWIVYDIIIQNCPYYYKPFEEILTTCDIITLHIPLKNDEIDNTNFITKKELDMMKPNVRLLNMSRGGIINEPDLIAWLKERPKACAAIDSYVSEEYHGELCKLGNAYLTPHLGSCTVTSKERMQSEAVEEVQRFIDGKPLKERLV
jgi:D-3-phosphoglycerate dehydrogenase